MRPIMFLVARAPSLQKSFCMNHETGISRGKGKTRMKVSHRAYNPIVKIPAGIGSHSLTSCVVLFGVMYFFSFI